MTRADERNAEVHEVLGKIDHQKTISILREMVKIKTENPPGNEEALCLYIDEKCRSLGLETKLVYFQDKRSSLVAKFSQDRKQRSLLLNGHTDTVGVGERDTWSMDPYGCTIKDGRFFGRGTSDMKGGLASMLVAIEAVVDSGFEPMSNWAFSVVADEEDLGRGTMALFSSGALKGTSLAIFGEPTNMEVVTAHRGSLWLEVSARGVAAHGSMPVIGANSIVAVSAFVDQLGKIFSNKETFNIPDDVSSNIGMICGGTKINVVPNVCTVGLDFRYGWGYDADLIVSMLKKILKTGEEKNPMVELTLKELQRRQAVCTEATNPLVQKCLAIVSDVLKREMRPVSMPYSTDASILAQHMKIPLIILGPGKPALAHRTDEYVELSALQDATKTYAALILKL